MKNQRYRWLVTTLLVVAAFPEFVQAQLQDPVKELTEARRIYIPSEDLDVIIERDKQGVILSRAKFDLLMTQAKANAEKNAVPAGASVVVTAADYATQIAGDQLLISVTAELTQFDDDWRETKFNMQRLSVEQALLDGSPALLGRHPDGSVSLFTESRGKHVLRLQVSTELTAQGSDQVAGFSLLRAPSGLLTLSLPAGKRLLIGNLQLPRPAALDQVADYRVAVGGTGGVQLRITDRAAENAADSLTFASTGYGLNVAPGEVTWHALTTLQVFGKPVDRLSFSVPSRLEIADVEASGLESWNLSDDPNDPQRTNISLIFGQAFDGIRKISFKGVMSVETSKPWAVPPLGIASVTSHIGQVIVQHAAGVRLRIEETAGVRRASYEQKPAADMPDDMAKFNATEFLRFDAWQPDFTLRLSTQPKQREIQCAVAAVLDVNATGLELQAALTVETHFAPLFELDVHIPSEWQVLSVQKDNLPLKWQIVTLDQPGLNHLRILFDPPIAAEGTGQIRLALRRDVEGWPVEAEPIVVNLPELHLPQSNLTEGAFVVRGDDDLDLAAFDLTGLDPLPLKADFERLRFQSQDTRFAGKLKMTRKPSRIAAQTVTVGRIDPQTFHTFLQAIVEVQGGRVRSIKVALPEATGTTVRFECPGPRIVEQKPASPANGEIVWTLQFDQRLRGQALVTCDIEMPRGETKEFVMPQWRFVDAERQNGYFAVEAAGEQRLTIVANNPDGSPLSEIDPLDLPNVFYQPKERIVAVHRAATSGAVLTLSEQKFEKLPVPTAICPLLAISTILGRTGELQHRATFHLNVVGVQGLHVTFPTGTTLWATLVDGMPVEVRRNGDVYLVPLTVVATPGLPMPPNTGLPEGGNTLRLFYRSEVSAVSQFGTLTQEPPTLTVESGQRIALPVEVLEQKWDLYYPEETRLVESRSPLEPEQPLDSTGVLGNWNSRLRVLSLKDFGLHLLLVIVTAGAFWFLMHVYRPKTLMITQLVLIFGIIGILFLLKLPARQLLREDHRAEMAVQSEMKGLRPESSSKVVESLAVDSEDSRLPIHYYADDDVTHFPKPIKEPAGINDNVNLKSHTIRNRFQRILPQPASSTVVGLRSPNHGDEEVAQNENPQAGEKRERIQGIGAGIAVDARDMGEKHPESSVNLGLLSLAIDFVPPAGSREKRFHYFGADTPQNGIPLEVDYVDRHSGTAMRIFVMALVAMIGWFTRSMTMTTKVTLATIGFVLPLVLLPLVPMNWQPFIDGAFFGTIIAIVIWLVCGCIHQCGSCCWGGLPFKKSSDVASTVSAVITLLFVSGIASAGDKEQPPNQSPVAPVKMPTTLIIPFDVGTEPLASERIFLSHEQFLQLYRLANPDKGSKQLAPQSGGIFEALYAAKLIPNATVPDESIVEVTARYAVRNFVDGQFVVDLPVGQVSARSAKLDGQTAALIANSGNFKVAVPKPGMHVIDFTFAVPARLSGTTGSFVLPLLTAPAGKLAFELPAKDLSIRVNGSTTIFRRVTNGASQSLELPIDKGGEITIAWQPEQSKGAAAAIVNVDSVEAITVVDAGTSISHGYTYRVRQGGIADTSFSLPDTLRLQAVNGPDVGGWELQGEGAARKLRVIFRRNVTDQTQVTIETFLDAKVGSVPTLISIPQVAPQEVTNEIGQVAVFPGGQFSVRAEQVESLIQIDGDKFSTQVPVSRPNVAPQLAYRFSKRPFSLNLRLTRLESQANVVAQQAAFITLRKQNLTTRLRYQLTGAPRSSLSIALPEKFVLLDVQATGLRDWYLTPQDDHSTLTVELNSPTLGLVEVVIGGFTPRDVASGRVTFPQALDATRLDSTAAVWLDEGFAGTLETFEGWKFIDASQIGPELRAVRAEKPVQFAFLSTNTAPSTIAVKLVQSSPKLSANGLAMVTVTDVAVIYTLALQWQIDIAKTDALTLTTPKWLAGKLDFQGDGIREASQVDAGNDRARWTINLRTPISGKYFATATATLPAASTEVLAPALVFENEQKALDSQRQYVLLINSSLNQLTSVDPQSIESVQREDVPVVVQQEFIDQATELVRVKTLLAAPKWSLHKFAQQQSAPASVNVADLTTVLSRDGTYRAQAIYTIKNRSRQFLALKMPDGTELLSVFVAGQPARAVTTKLASLNGSAVQLIALPKTSAASLSFQVKIVWRGRLGRALPKSSTLGREEFGVPAPQILSQQDDPEYGIPVARTRWTVYVPNDLDAQSARSTSKHNLSLSDDSDVLYGNAAMQEAADLLGYVEQLRESSRYTKSRNNTKQLGLAIGNMKQLGTVLDNYSASGNSEFARNKAEVIRRLSEAEKLAKTESQNQGTVPANANAKPGQPSPTILSDNIVDGIEIAQEQQRALLESNGGNGIQLDSSALKRTNSDQDGESFNFSLASKDTDTSPKSDKSAGKPATEIGKSVKGNATSRAALRQSNDANVFELNSTVTNNSLTRNSNQAAQQNLFGTGVMLNQQGNGLYLQNTQIGGQQGQVGNAGGGFGGSIGNSNFGNGIITGNSAFGVDIRSNGFVDNQAIQRFDQNQPAQSFSTMGDQGMSHGGGMGGRGFSPPLVPTNPGGGVFFSNDGIPVSGAAGFNGRIESMPQPSDGPSADPLSRDINGDGIPDNGELPFGYMAQQNAKQGRGVVTAGGGSISNVKQAGGLSLEIELPKSGQKLVFTKSGGDPKLALDVRARQSVRRGVNLVWSAVWIMIGATILLTLRKPSGLQRLKDQLPVIVVILGILGFCVLPTSFSIGSFVLFLMGMFAIAKRTPTDVVQQN